MVDTEISMGDTEIEESTKIMTVWFDDDDAIIGRELTDDESEDLTKEQLREAIKNAGYSLIVRDDTGLHRVYINVTNDDSWRYDRGSFEIDLSLPCFRRLWNAMEHEYLAPVRREDGQFALRYDQAHHSYDQAHSKQAEVNISCRDIGL